MMSRISPTRGRENSVLDMDWPEPLILPEAVARHAPWLIPGKHPVVAYVPPKLFDVATLVTSQENACRYCYGAQRTAMRLYGYSEEQIRDLEREVQLADGLTREVVNLARKLAKSNPMPVRAELLALERAGLDPRAIAEIVFGIAISCFTNRVATFLALPPERGFERLAESFLGRLIGALIARGIRTRRAAAAPPATAEGSLAPLIQQLSNAPMTGWYAELLRQCLAAPALPRRTKLLMLAVIARSLDCRFCEKAARSDLEALGLPADRFDQILATLAAPELSQLEGRLLSWARETVHYEPGIIQKRTRALAGEVGVDVLLEAVGTAAVSNSAVRLSMLLE